MKKTVLVIGFVTFAIGLYAQKSYDFGLFMGMTGAHKYTILPIPDENGLSYAAGGYYRYSLNPRYSLRAGANFGFDRVNMNPNMVEGYGFFEFNFHPLSTKRDRELISSYIDIGLSYLVDLPLYNSISQTPDASRVSYMIRNVRIPFNVGVRYNVTPKLTLGIEWDLRKGYQKDYLIPSQPAKNFMLSNWRSHVGITIGYMVINRCKTCPFYDNERNKLK